MGTPDPLEALKHSRWRRLYLVVVCLVGIVVFQILVIPRALRIAYTHIAVRRMRTRNVRYSSHAPRNVLDVYVPDNNKNNYNNQKYPVVVFCHGGAWNSGDKLHYCTLAHTMVKNNIVAVVINYTLYPEGLVEDMVKDITEALTWTKTNIGQYGGDSDNIYFVGHSAGAHLGALAIFQHIQKSSNNNEQVLVKGFIGLAGPYCIRDHYQHEFKRGVEHLSPMKPTMGGITNFHFNSPSTVITTMDKKFISKLCSFYILHGDMDSTVPVSSSIKFAKHLKEMGANVTLYEYKGLGHSHVLFDLMDNLKTSEVVRDVVKIVKQEKTS